MTFFQLRLRSIARSAMIIDGSTLIEGIRIWGKVSPYQQLNTTPLYEFSLFVLIVHHSANKTTLLHMRKSDMNLSHQLEYIMGMGYHSLNW